MRTVEDFEWRHKNEANGVILVSLLLTVNKFCSNYWICTSRRFLGLYWKDKYFWRQDRVYHALCCSISVWTKFINKWHLNLYHHNPTGESVRNICEGVNFRCSFWLKRCRSHTKWPAVHLSFYRFCSWLTQLILSCCKLLLRC